MKKRITAMLLSVQMLAAMVPICAAAPEVSYSYDEETEVLSVSFDTGDGAETVIALNVKNAGDEYTAVKELNTENGRAEIKLSIPIGTYTLTAKRQDTMEVLEKEISLTGEADAAIISAVQTAIADSDAAMLDKLAADNADYLGTVKTDGAGTLMLAAEAVPDTVEEFAELYNGFAVAAALNAATEGSALDSLLGNEALAKAMALDTALPLTDGKNVYDYSSEEVRAKIAEAVCGKNDYSTITDVLDTLKEEILFANLYYGTTDAAEAILEIYIEKTLVEADWSAFEDLSDSLQRTVIEGMKSEYTSYEVVGSDFDKLVENASDKPKTSSGGGGGGGGSSGITVGTPAATAPTPTPETENTESTLPAPQYIFSDMENAKWAYEAVECLYNRGVISGVGDGKYAPDKTITRAEFAKMLMSMVNVGEHSGNGIPFGDVLESDWSYKYIASAYENGIVYGLSDNEFGKNEYVTREQAAVFIERLIDKFEENKPDPGLNVFIEFDDMDDASDWAKESILYLLQVSMIKGKENKNYKPKDYLTRAEAAALFYSYLVVMGREGQ
ncbi:MAG: S-layer homology domain-containing protein [Clostridia bacterium]|nr:S-layer homology domain-containing protein [Clostridia bacterium]